MNKRIKELAVLATKTVDHTGAFGLTQTTSTVDLEKFAELIVRECARVAEKEQAYNDSHEIHVNIDQCILIEFGL